MTSRKYDWGLGYLVVKKNAGSIAVELAFGMIIFAAIVSAVIPLVKEVAVESLDKQADTISKHYP